MLVTLVYVDVKPEHITDFKKACTENHNNSVLEDGNLRFDILQSAEEPTKFTLYEAYDSKKTAKAHKETDHYKKWRDAVAPWMA